MSISKKKLYERYLSRVEPLLSSPLHAEMADALFKGKTKVLRLSRYESSAFDTSWVDVIEDVLYDLGEIIKAPRTITKEVGSLTPIELAKKVNSESIQHLSSHTQYVKNIDEDGNVIPSKVMSFSNDDFLFTYENRFIATFIRRLVLFVEKRYEFIQAYIPLHKEEVLMVKTTATIDGEEVEIETRIKSKAECMDPAAQSAAIVAARIRRMREYILYYYSSPFMKKMKNERDVRKPILMTNILRKNVRYHKCYECFTFLERYESLGLNYKSDDTYHSFSEEQLKEMALLNLGQFLALQDGTEYEVIKTRPHAYKPRIMTSIDDEQFLFGPLPKGPIEFVRVDEEYRKYLEARAARELPERPKKAEKEYYENEYGDRRDARSELKEIDKLLRRKQAAIKRFEKDLEAIIALREYEDNLLLQWEYQERLDTEELRLNQKRAEIAADALGYHPEEATLDELLARAKEEVEEGGHRDYYVNPDEEELAFRAEHGDLGDTWKKEQGYASSDQPYFGVGNEGQMIYTVGQGEPGEGVAPSEGQEAYAQESAEPAEEDLERLDQAAFQEGAESASNVPMEGEAASQSETAAENVAAEGAAAEEGASITQGQEASNQEGAAETSQEGVAEQSAQEGQTAGAEDVSAQEGVAAEGAVMGAAEGATTEEAGGAAQTGEGAATGTTEGAEGQASVSETAEGAVTGTAEGQASASEGAEGTVTAEGTSTAQQVVVAQEGETVLLAEGGESTEASADGQTAILSPLGETDAEQASRSITEGAGMVIMPDGSLSEESASFASENAEENQKEAVSAGKKPFIVVKGTGGDRDYSPIYDRPVEEIVMDEMLGLEVAAPKKRPIKKNKPKKAEPVKEEAPAPMVPVEESILEEMLGMPMEEPTEFSTSYQSQPVAEPVAEEEPITEPENAPESFEAAEPEQEEAVAEEPEAIEEPLTQEEPAEETVSEQEEPQAEEELSEEDEDALKDLAALDGASEEEVKELQEQETAEEWPMDDIDVLEGLEESNEEVPIIETIPASELESFEQEEPVAESEQTEEEAAEPVQEHEEPETPVEPEQEPEEEIEAPAEETEAPAEEAPVEEATEPVKEETEEQEPAAEEETQDEVGTEEPLMEEPEETVEEVPAEEPASESMLEEVPEEESSALDEGEEPSDEEKVEEPAEEPVGEEPVQEEPTSEDYDIFIEEEEDIPALPEIPAEPAPKYATPGYVAPSRGLASIPGAFVVKTPEGYYVSEGVFAKGKNKAKVFTDFNQANNAKKRFGGKVVKL